MKKLFTLNIALMLIVTTTAQTYHEDDKEGLRIFLRQPSAVAGKMNAEQLGLQISDTANWQTDEAWVTKVADLTWNNETPKRLISIGSYNWGWNNKNLSGTLNASKWTKLKGLYYSNNPITALKLNANTELEFLYCAKSQLTTLDLSANTKLIMVQCFNNQLSILDLSANMELEILDCSNNQLTALDLSSNTNLNWLYCNNNQLTTLKPNGKMIDCSNNQLIVLDLSNMVNLYRLICSNNQLSVLDLSNMVNLHQLTCSNNQLSVLDLTNMAKLNHLTCSNNQLTELYLSSNTELEVLNCYNNQLSALDLSAANMKLYHIVCYNNHLILSDLFTLSEIWKSNWSPGMFPYGLGNQTLPSQTIPPGTELDFSVPQNVFNGIYTEFSVTQNGNPAPESDYTITDGKITFHTLGTYNVKMTNNAIISSSEHPAEVLFNTVTVGIVEKDKEVSGLIIYPNPANSHVTITNYGLRATHLEIFDITGKIIGIYPCTDTTTTIDISQLHTGIYFVRIDGKIAKLIKL